MGRPERGQGRGRRFFRVGLHRGRAGSAVRGWGAAVLGAGCPGRAAPGVPVRPRCRRLGQGSPCAARELGRSCAEPVGRVPGASPMGSRARRPLPSVAGGTLGVAAPRSCARRWLCPCPRPRPELLLGGRGPGTALARCFGALTQTGLLRAQSHTWGHRVLLSRPPRIALTVLSLPAGPGLPIAHRWACEVWGLRGSRGMRGS